MRKREAKIGARVRLKGKKRTSWICAVLCGEMEGAVVVNTKLNGFHTWHVNELELVPAGGKQR